MHIFSLILSTITSVINAGAAILAINGGFAASYTSSAVGLVPRSITPLIYDLLLPTIFIFLIFSLSKSPDQPKKSPQKSLFFLRASFALTALQAIVSIIIYQSNYTAITSAEQFAFNPLPVIIEGAVIALTFVGAIICSIKAASVRTPAASKPEFSISPKLFALVALSLGILEIILDLIPAIIFRTHATSAFPSTMIKWTEYLRMLNPAIFALAVVLSTKKPDKYFILSWLGVALAFSARILLYLIAYL